MRQRKGAFTLIELLTVIGIITLLVGILIPTLSAARRAAKANVCLSSLSGVGKSFLIYLNENENYFPPFRLKESPPGGAEPAKYINEFRRRAPRWQWFLETDMGPLIDPKPFQSSIDQQGYFDDDSIKRPGVTPDNRMSHEMFTCPSMRNEDHIRHVRNGAYGYNYQYLGNTRSDSNPGRWDNFAIGLHRISNPALTVNVADSRGADPEHGKHSYALDPPRLAIEARARRFGPGAGDVSDRGDDRGIAIGEINVYQYSPVEMRHNDQGNVLFVDGHAESMTLVELGYDVSDRVGIKELPKGTAIPISTPETGPYTATNRLWTGHARDDVALKANPQGDVE